MHHPTCIIATLLLSIAVTGCSPPFQSTRQSLANIDATHEVANKREFLAQHQPFFDLLDQPLNQQEKKFVGRRNGNIFGEQVETYEVIYRQDHTSSMVLTINEEGEELEFPSHGVWAVEGNQLFLLDIVYYQNGDASDSNTTGYVQSQSQLLKFHLDPVGSDGKWTFTMPAWTDSEGQVIPESDNIEAPIPGLFTTEFMQPYNHPQALRKLDLLGLFADAEFQR